MVDSDIKCLKFLDPFPLLAGSDIDGNISIWTTDPYPEPYRCLVNWKNMFNLQKFSAITAIDFQVFSDPVEGIEESMLYVGDKMGYIRVFSLESLLRHSEIAQIPLSFKEKRRVSAKIEDIDYQGRVTEDDKLAFQKKFGGDPSGKSGNVKQVLQWKAHNEAVNQITILNALQPILIMTVSNDKMVRFWNLRGENVSNLYQGKTVNESWKIKVSEGQRDNTMIKYFKQFKGDLANKYDKQKARIRELITEFTDTYEYENLARIQNDDIFKNFTELEKSIATTLGKTSNNSGIRPKAKKR